MLNSFNTDHEQSSNMPTNTLPFLIHRMQLSSSFLTLGLQHLQHDNLHRYENFITFFFEEELNLK